MMRRSWLRVAIANAAFGLAFALVAASIDDPAARVMAAINALSAMIVTAWALRKDDGHGRAD